MIGERIKTDGSEPHEFQAPAVTRNYVEDKWFREKLTASPKPLLYELWHFFEIDKADAPAPDLGYLRALRLINPDLSVHWIGRYERWGVFLKKRVYTVIEVDGNRYIEFDTFPALIDIIENRKGEFMELSHRTLPELNLESIDVHRYLMRLREVELEYKRRIRQKRKLLWGDIHSEIKPIVTQKLFGKGVKPMVFIPSKN